MSMNILKSPIIAIGFKSYLEAIGDKALALAKTAEKVSKETDVTFILLPQHTDIRLITQSVTVPVFATHIDPIEPGPGTGYILPEAAKEAGASGFIINHIEHRTTLNNISKAIKRSKELNLTSAVCTESPEESQAATLLGADIIIAELPEYISGKKAVSIYAKEFISQTVKSVKAIKSDVLVLSGGSIKNYQEAKAALELGLNGTGGARNIVKATNPYEVMRDIAEGAKDGWHATHPPKNTS